VLAQARLRGRFGKQSRPRLALTNIVEDWPAMFGSTADQVKSGKLFGTFIQYGYETAPVIGVHEVLVTLLVNFVGVLLVQRALLGAISGVEMGLKLAGVPIGAGGVDAAIAVLMED
jgi:hypothetical protein